MVGRQLAREEPDTRIDRIGRRGIGDKRDEGIDPCAGEWRGLRAKARGSPSGLFQEEGGLRHLLWRHDSTIRDAEPVFLGSELSGGRHSPDSGGQVTGRVAGRDA